MGSPGEGDREKDLSKRRKSESSHYVKARHWEDEEGYDEDRRHRSSKAKKSSKGDREREKAREKDRDSEREREKEREPERVGRCRDEYYEKVEKRLHASREDRHEEVAERHDWEFVESRAGSSKRRNSSEKLGKKIEAVVVREDKEGVGADYEVNVVEGPVWKHERAYELEEEKVKKAEPRVAKSPEKERGRKGELRDGRDEKYRKSDSRTARGEGLDEDFARKKSSHRGRHHVKEDDGVWKKESKPERGHDYVEVVVRKLETRAERFLETDDEKVRSSNTYVEEAQNSEIENYQRADLKVDLRAERVYESQDSLRTIKGDYRVVRTHDNDDETNYEIDFLHERAGKIVTSSGMEPSQPKCRKNVEEKKSGGRIGRVYSRNDEKDLRNTELQLEAGERHVESIGVENYPRSSNRNEKSREHVGRDRGTGDRDRSYTGVVGVEEPTDSVDSKQLHKWERELKRNGTGKSHGDLTEREESKKDRVSRVQRIGEDRAAARSEHRKEVKDLPGSYENVSESRGEKGSTSHGRRKERNLSRWDKHELMLEEIVELVREKNSRGGNGTEEIQSKWDEPEEDTLSNRALENERESGLRELDTVDAVQSEEAEEGIKYAVLKNLGKSEPIVHYELSQDFEKIVTSAEADPGGEEQGDESQLEKPERHRRAKERLEREDSDEWEKSAHHKEKMERDWRDDNHHFDYDLQGGNKSEWDDVEDGSKLEGEMEEGTEEVRKSGRRRGRDTLEREDYDFGGRFLARDEKDRDRERGREREREKEREKERQRERDKGIERGRDRGRERERRDEHNWDEHLRKGSERYEERYHEHDIGGRSSVRGREDRLDHDREKYRSREAGREELDDRHGRLNCRDRREEERTGKLASKELIRDFVRGASVAREKEEEDRLRRLRLEEEKGKKPASREFVDETRLVGSKADDLVDRVWGIGKDSGLDLSDDGGRLKGKYGKVVTSSRSPDDRRESYKSVKAVITTRSPDDRRGGLRAGKAFATSRSPVDRRGEYRSSKAVSTSRSPDDRRGRSDWDGIERDWSDDRNDYDREKCSKRRGNQKRDRESGERERDRYRSRERPHDRSWERGKEKARVDAIDRSISYDRHQNRWKGSRDAERGRDVDYQVEEDNWESKKRHENADGEKLERKMSERESSDRTRMDRERVEEMRSPQGFASMSEISGRGHQTTSNFLESGRGFISYGGSYMLPSGDPVFFQGDYFGGMGEVDWDGPVMDDRMRQREGVFLGGGDRFMDNDGPPGHDPGFGPSRGGAGDGGMIYNHHPGRGRGSKVSPNNRGRGGTMGHEGRLYFNNNQTGPMLRGMQQQQQPGGKGRGPRGGPKGARGPGREVQRASGNPPLMGPGPGIGPHFGPMGPQGLMPGMGMGPGPGPGPTPGPNMGQFSLLPFGGPMGWGGGPGGGEMGMLGCPPGSGPVMGPGPGGLGPRFGPGMVPGPGPNIFFNPPGPGRGGPGVMLTGSFSGGAPPFNGPNGDGGRGQMGERCLPVGGRGLIGRANGPPGRGPSRGEQNDYSQHFVDTGLRPQNFIRDVELADRFEEYPKLKELITRKDQLIAKRATSPMYMQCDLRTTKLGPDVFGTKFDVILVDPPWEEYVRRAPGIGDSMEWWSHEEIENLRIEAIADTPAFLFLWVGDAEGLEQGRRCLKKWGFRRCEDICWVKTNRGNPTPALRHDSNTLFQHSKEHCLMGIKGTVRRSTDGHIIHANVDTDIMISEEPEYGSTKKPEELYHIIEHFAQGMRRIELFGEDHNIRAGWVTVGKGLTSSNFNPQTYAKNFADTEGKVWQGGRGNPAIDAPHLVGTTPEIEALRPKSPPPRPQAQPSGQGNAGNSLSQASAGNSISKKSSTRQVGGVQNGHPAALIPGAGHGSAPSGTGTLAIGQPHVGGRGGGHGQIPKMRPILPGTLMKPLGAGPGIVELGNFDEEASYGGDMHEATSTDDALI
ncbi:hypothetical protein KC19_VG244900 [Ceratodon purpureus]|uniref:Uncharacterized protein n=1 Tax=Ceratodon purpureus TaxID=3225 RepID=A0A8T0HT59_CERPU|nr:hypothetical protein KC19_VG244900 [Ceratodon purpureus]